MAARPSRSSIWAPHSPRFGNATTACDAISDIASAIYQPLEEELRLVGVRRCGRELPAFLAQCVEYKPCRSTFALLT